VLKFINFRFALFTPL
jgi:hypothetical protein